MTYRGVARFTSFIQLHSLQCNALVTSLWREAKKSNREEKEKFDILFSNFEKRKRNLKFLSPVSRGEREIWKKVLHFREEKEKGIFFSQVSRGEREFFLKVSNFEKRKRNLKFFSPVLRREREIWKSVLHFREEKEKWILFSQDSRGEGEFLPGFLKSFPFLQIIALPTKALEKVKVSYSFTCFVLCLWSWWLALICFQISLKSIRIIL